MTCAGRACPTTCTVSAVPVAGNFTVGGEAPPNSVYEDGRIYLRNTSTGDAVLLVAWSIVLLALGVGGW